MVIIANKSRESAVCSLINFQETGTFSDVTLVGDDKEHVYAHKVVLSAVSDFFNSLLSTNDNSASFIYIEGVNSEAIKNVLQYVYHGEVNVSKGNEEHFLHCAKGLKLEGIMNTNSDDRVEKEDRSERRQKKNKKRKENKDLTKFEDKAYQWKKISDLTDSFKEESLNKNREKEVIDLGKDFSDFKELHKKLKSYYSIASDDNYHCSVCDYKTVMKVHMEEHLEAHVKGLEIKCNICNIIQRRSASLRKHTRLHHKLKNSWTEKDLRKMNLSTTKAPEPKEHIDDAVFSQEHSFDVGSIENLNKTLEEYFTIEPGSKFKCNVCEEVKEHHVQILKHIYVHTENFVYYCKKCNKQIHSGRKIKEHVRHYHTLKKNNLKKVIPIIDGFEEMSCHEKLMALQEYHTRLYGSTFECKICGKTGRSSGHIVDHLETHCRGLQYQCEFCKKLCKTSCALRSHKRLRCKDGWKKKGDLNISENGITNNENEDGNDEIKEVAMKRTITEKYEKETKLFMESKAKILKIDIASEATDEFEQLFVF